MTGLIGVAGIVAGFLTLMLFIGKIRSRTRARRQADGGDGGFFSWGADGGGDSGCGGEGGGGCD